MTRPQSCSIGYWLISLFLPGWAAADTSDRVLGALCTALTHEPDAGDFAFALSTVESRTLRGSGRCRCRAEAYRRGDELPLPRGAPRQQNRWCGSPAGVT